MLISILVLTLALVPNFVWLFFYLSEDPHPEPKPLLTIAFLLGILAVGAAFIGQKGLLNLLSSSLNISPQIIINTYAFIILAAFWEEIVKFLMARILLWRNPAFDEPIDAMIYLIVIALGFAFMENLLYLRNYLDSFYNIVSLTILRFVSANLLHAVSSGTIGYFWAKGIVYHRKGRHLFWGLLLAGIVHSAYNVLAFSLNNIFLTDLPVILILIVGLFVLRDFEKLKQLSRPVTLTAYFKKEQTGSVKNPDAASSG